MREGIEATDCFSSSSAGSTSSLRAPDKAALAGAANCSQSSV
ncbi:hypothetical protein [Streptomyces sp. NRRL S-87]|nr:hypothetical protein [Streptomyces sp. NRRL S-87]